MSERWNAQLQLEHMQQKYVGAGHADMTRWEWGTNIQRDSMASHIGHHPRLIYMAMAQNYSLARTKHQMLWKMVQPCGPRSN